MEKYISFSVWIQNSDIWRKTKLLSKNISSSIQRQDKNKYTEKERFHYKSLSDDHILFFTCFAQIREKHLYQNRYVVLKKKKNFY